MYTVNFKTTQWYDWAHAGVDQNYQAGHNDLFVDPERAGLYIITNTKSQARYVGKTSNYVERFATRWRVLRECGFTSDVTQDVVVAFIAVEATVYNNVTHAIDNVPGPYINWRANVPSLGMGGWHLNVEYALLNAVALMHTSNWLYGEGDNDLLVNVAGLGGGIVWMSHDGDAANERFSIKLDGRELGIGLYERFYYREDKQQWLMLEG